MTTAQIFFNFVTVVLVVAGCWFYFIGGPLRQYPAMTLITSGWYIDSLNSGANPYYIFFLWSIVMIVLRVIYIGEKDKLRLPKLPEDEQSQPSGN